MPTFLVVLVFLGLCSLYRYFVKPKAVTIPALESWEEDLLGAKSEESKLKALNIPEVKTLANKPEMAEEENMGHVSEMKEKDQNTEEPDLDAVSFPLNREQMGERKFKFFSGVESVF